MTKFKIQSEGLIIGFEEHLNPDGPEHWYNEKVELKDRIPGPFPTTEEHERILESKPEPNRREEKR